MSSSTVSSQVQTPSILFLITVQFTYLLVTKAQVSKLSLLMARAKVFCERTSIAVLKVSKIFLLLRESIVVWGDIEKFSTIKQSFHDFSGKK